MARTYHNKRRHLLTLEVRRTNDGNFAQSLALVSMIDSDLKIMFVSRGNGWGHAVPDIVIISELKRRRPRIQVLPVSYADGVDAYRTYGVPVVDLHRARQCQFLDLLIDYARVFGEYRPDLVVAHEEYSAVIAAKIARVPCLFMTDFFMDPTSLPMQCVQHASEVIFLGRRGLFAEPPFLAGRILHAGCVVRGSKGKFLAKSRIRKRCGVDQGATVVLCQPGSWPEAQSPLIDLLAKCWEYITPPKFLLVVSGVDDKRVFDKLGEMPDVRIIAPTKDLHEYMMACDVLITKGNRQTVYEASSLGLPSISLSSGLNWPDDVVMHGITSNLPLSIYDVTPHDLAQAVAHQAALKPAASGSASGGANTAAERIELYCDALLSLSGGRDKSSAIS